MNEPIVFKAVRFFYSTNIGIFLIIANKLSYFLKIKLKFSVFHHYVVIL